MKSLRELCVDAIVRHDPEGREELPLHLQDELADLEKTILDTMYGWDCRRDHLDWWGFDVSWEKGSWRLTLRERAGTGRAWQRWFERRAEIQAGVRTRLEPCWARLFSIDGTAMHEVVLENHRADPRRRVVTFAGRGIPEVKEFSTQFDFTNAGWGNLRIKSEQTNGGGTITRRVLQFSEYGGQ